MIFESFVGRERELGHLNAVREDTLRTRRGSVVSITGEPGIGKSRLLHEFRSGFGRSIAAGTARARDGASIPYGTWQQMLSAITVPQRPAVTAALAQARLSADAEGVATADERVATIVNDVCDLARAAGGLSLVIDDLQFCDRASLDALRVLAERVEEHPIVLVLAMRNIDGSDLSRITTFARIERLATTRIRLLPISDEYLAPLLARTLAPDRIAPVLRLAEGSPFAAEELGRAAATRSSSLEDIPLSLSGAIVERFERLDPEAREILVRAAVLGRDFTFEDLAHITDDTEAHVLTALRAARDAQLIAEDSASVTGAFRFRHALTREALYRRLLRVEATRIHTAVADRLEADAPERIAEIAFHRWSAGDAVRAPLACFSAAQRAGALGAPSDAIEQCFRALSFDSLEANFLASASSFAALNLHAVGREDEAYEVARATRLRIDPARNPIAASRALTQEAQQAVMVLEFEDSARLYDAAERILDQQPPSIDEGRTRSRLAMFRAISFNVQGRYADARAQLNLMQSPESETPEFDACRIIGALLLFEEAKIDDSIAALERCLVSGTKPTNLAVVALNLAYAYWHLGRLDRARETTETMGDIARANGQQVFVHIATAFRHLIDTTAGKFSGAIEHIRAQPPVEPMTRLLLSTLRANLSTWTGAVPAARLERELDAIGPSHVNATLFAGAMTWHRATEPAAAVGIVTRFLSKRERYAFDFEDATFAFADETIARDRLERLEAVAQIPQHRAARAYALLGRARLAERRSNSIEAARYGREATSAFAALGYPIQRARAAWIAREFAEARDVLHAVDANAELARLEGRVVETAPALESTLSRREEQVARAAAAGASIKEIASDLGIGVRTVETHLQNAYGKLGVRTRIELARHFTDVR